MESVIKAIKEYQCPGCMKGYASDCDYLKVNKNPFGFYTCSNHFPSTICSVAGQLLLGCPKGFNHLGPIDKKIQTIFIHIWEKGTKPDWDKYNIPTWTRRVDGNVFVKTYSPRINLCFVEILLETTELPEGALDIESFIDEMD